MLINGSESQSYQAASSGPLRVGIYARFSNEDLQRDSSIVDQVRQCRDLSSKNGWIVLDDYVRSDPGISGQSLQRRPGVKSLMHDVEHNPGCLDGIVFDDTSRLGRNLSEVLLFCNFMKFYGVFLYFVNQEIDSRDKSFYNQIIEHGKGDEQFLFKLSHAVKRGAKGRILEGMIHGGRYYGYRGVLIPDPTKRGSLTRPAIKGVKLEIDEVQASCVHRIYDWAEQGLSFLQIVAMCEAESLPRHDSGTEWNISAISTILHSELYRGLLIWGRTTNIKHPMTGRYVNRSKPKDEWVVNKVPGLQIISDDQWQRVQSAIASHKRFGLSRLGGIGRGKQSILLLSGKLFCGTCGSPIVVTGKTPNGERTYSCKKHRYKRKGCDNKLVLHSSVIEQAVIQHIVQRISNPDELSQIITKVHGELSGELSRRLKEYENTQSVIRQMDEEKRRIDQEMRNLIAAIRENGHSAALLSEVNRLEDRLKVIEDRRAEGPPVSHNVSLDEVRRFVNERAGGFCEMLLGDRHAAQQALRNHIGKLTLTPGTENGLPVYRVKGEVSFVWKKT